jgi:tRNA threonylcarbamoyladenosine dehydratase
MPVLGTMPAFFGLAVANFVMLEISEYPHEPLVAKSRDKLYESAMSNLNGYEIKLSKKYGHDTIGLKTPISSDDVAFLMEEVYRGRSVISGVTTKLVLIRWKRPEADPFDASIPGQKTTKLSLEDLVCMTKEEATRHEKQIQLASANPVDLYDDKIVDLVTRRLDEIRAINKYR